MWLSPTYEDSTLYQEYPYVLLIALIFNGLSLVSLSLLMSTFLFDSKVASQIGTFILFLPCSVFLFSFVTVVVQYTLHLVADALDTTDDEFLGHYLFQIGYILPHFSFGIVFLEFLTKGGATLLGFNVVFAWISLILQTPIYLALYLYFDAVVPNQFGIALKCCFCCKRGPKTREQRLQPQEYEMLEGTQNPIITKKLGMTFGKVKALQDFTITIEQGEVLSLLGHNGAGKTTAINCLTGLLRPTEGDAFVYGSSLVNDVDDVRRNLGLCQ